MFLGNVSIKGVPLLVTKEMYSFFFKSSKTEFPSKFHSRESHFLPWTISDSFNGDEEFIDANKQNQIHGLFYHSIINTFLYVRLYILNFQVQILLLVLADSNIGHTCFSLIK